MRVWATADPRHLNRKHLLGEHVEVHMLIKAVYGGKGWIHHPEAKRFAADPEFLIFRHELLRIELDRRWPGRHTPNKHKTPVREHLLTADRLAFLLTYRDGLYDEWCDEREQAEMFDLCMRTLFNSPPPSFTHDTPWDRDEMTIFEYTDLGDAWNAAEHKKG